MAEIVNLRGNTTSKNGASTDEAAKKSSSNPLADSIIEGLTRSELRTTGSDEESKHYTYTKHIPTMVLYDDRGLDIYDQITQCEEYYLYNSELTILQKHGESIAKRLLAYPVSASKIAGVGTSASPDRSATSTPSLSEHASTEDSSTISDEKEDKTGEEAEQEEEEDGYTGLPQRLDVKEKWGDSSVGRNNFGVNGNLGLGEGAIPSTTTTTSIIELGAGSLKKTSVLLKALANVRNSSNKDEAGEEGVKSGKIKYYALDLEYRQLEETLAKLEQGSNDTVTLDGRKEGASDKIVAKGICASYEEAFPHLRDGSYDTNNTGKSEDDEKKCILFLGSSIGNYSRTEAIAFLRQIADEGMKAGDTLLIGIDSTDDKPMIEKAYNDSDNVTRSFILNGVDHVNQILGDVGLKQDDFEYKNRYNKEKGRHEAYIVPKKDVAFAYHDKSVTLLKDELVRIERSYKYSLHEALDLFGSSGLRVVDRWSTDAQGEDYHLWLLERPGFGFESTRDVIERGENPFGLPSLDEWDRLWKAWDCVTLSMIPQDLLHTKPIDLRHICLFYLGHIPGFLDIHMSRYLKEPYTEPAHFPDMFERGIDPNMDDPSKVHAHSVVPTRMEDWPLLPEIVEYRNRVRARLVRIYETRLADPDKTDRRLARTMAMVYEHEVMHLETLLYMAAQIPAGKLNCAPSFSKPDWAGLSTLWRKQVESERRSTRNLVQSYEASSISIGHDDSDDLDAETKYDAQHTFGWDNEAPKREVSVPAFKISLLPISNADYFRFWDGQGKPDSLIPGSWTVSPESQVSIKVLTEPSLVDLRTAEDWPCMASGKQLEAYAKSVGGRLPTEPELRRFMEDHPVDHVGANIGFMNWHPVPARLPNKLRNGTQAGASNGGIWEWTSTTFEAWEGWKASELYPDYSRDFFDGCHWVMLGGSFATIPRVAGRKTFTNWYQANYPYVFAGARVAYDA